MIRTIIFFIISAYFIFISQKSLFQSNTHGFYRFFAWESILALVLLNSLQWFQDPFSLMQLISWGLLLVSVFLVAQGLHLLRVVGKPDKARGDEELLDFEKTSTLVTVGIYKYIRHPLYSSLLFFTWGAYFKHASWRGALLAFISSICLFLTAKNDEAECIAHFGKPYQIYMQGTKRFIPFLF